MKRILLFVVLPISFVLSMSSFSLRENPQDPPRGKKAEKHIKMVRIDDSGNKSVLDTIISGDQIFVWNGDTIGKDLKWITRDSFVMDSIHQEFNFQVDSGNKKMIFIRSHKGDTPGLREFVTEIDSAGEIMIFKRGDRDRMMFDRGNREERILKGGIPVPPPPPARFLIKSDKGNVIDLSDKGIISYKKRKLSKGREKITIIRNEPAENETIIGEKIMGGRHDGAFMIKNGHPLPDKAITIIRNEDGNAENFRAQKRLIIAEDSDDVKVIHDDGKVIMIREKKEGEGKNVEVQVEVEEKK